MVSSRDLWDHNNRPADPRSGDLRHYREQGLIETVRVPGCRDRAVVFTKEGRSLLEHRRNPEHERHQTFHARLVRPRELEHDDGDGRPDLADDGVPVHELLAGHASITTTQRYMNARANSLAESMRQARVRRVKRLDEGGDQVAAQMG